MHPDAIHFGAMLQKRLAFPSLVVSSLNDPQMPCEQCRHYATVWGSDLIDLGHAGQINVASGFGPVSLVTGSSACSIEINPTGWPESCR
ncbi:alpha/beta hydrolase [Rhizobium herbae]|uniref:Alpha/beta hydrolase n=1 Tax=Rhizobium herbae TaxID=508661 RepID=A0ABS7HCU6_9HYPH|nr:alpha/beta hydrolase [Rhizobium herbae]